MWANVRMAVTLVFLALLGADWARGQAPDFQDYLARGKLADGEKALAAYLVKTPQDDNTRFALGAVQFFQAVEKLGNGFYRKGLRHHRGSLEMPLMRLPVPANPDPESIDYEELRKIFSDFVAGLAKAEGTLAAIKNDEVALSLRLLRIKLDLKGNGEPVPFNEIAAHYAGVPINGAEDGLLIRFDRGDVAWLRGYCHLLMAMGKSILAYDFDGLFQTAGHTFFQKANTTFKPLAGYKTPSGFMISPDVDITDLIAIIHMIRFPVKDGGKLAEARAHLLKVFALSRESWKFILAEKDNDHEWIPNPAQSGVSGIRVTREMVQGWLAFIGEAEDLFEGKKLIPFWRGPADMGINLKKVFTEPRTFDLVLWVQGSSAIPYLEKGNLTSPEVWRRLDRVFQGDLFRFGLWFN